MSVKIFITKPVIIPHLISELNIAGYMQVQIDFTISELWFTVMDSDDIAGVTAIYDATTGLPYPSDLRQAIARSIAKAIPNWVSWSQTDLLNWFNANISSTQINAETSLADAKIIQTKQSNAILSIGQLLIAFRDNIWPDLQDR